MSEFWNGVNVGEANAEMRASTRELTQNMNDGILRAFGFRSLGDDHTSLQQQAVTLRQDLETAKDRGIVAEAAFHAFKKCVASLPDNMRRQVEESITKNFQKEFLGRVQQQGLDTVGYDMPRVVAAWTPKVR